MLFSFVIKTELLICGFAFFCLYVSIKVWCTTLSCRRVLQLLYLLQKNREISVVRFLRCYLKYSSYPQRIITFCYLFSYSSYLYTFLIMKSILQAGVSTETVSPALCPKSALPTGEFEESRMSSISVFKIVYISISSALTTA